MTLGVIAIAAADNVGGFEIDASNTNGALYSGTDTPAGNDWAQGASQSGVFALSAAAPHDVAGCYGSNIDRIAAAGASAFICDGNSDTAFKATMPERNIVSPSGKTPDDVWPIKAGNVRPKNDFSHAYANGVFADSPCDADTLADDLMLRLGGHVGDNEGSHFWGFEFDRNAPGGFASLKANNGTSFNLDFNRVAGDLLISFTVPGNTADPVILDVFQVTNNPTQGQPAVFQLASPVAGCPAAQPQGLTRLATNNNNDVKAPPWGVPACDPTATNASNSCRLVTGGAADNLLPPRDFAEAAIDLTAFGVLNPCFTNVIFTSRSSHPLEGADIQDVGGGDFPLCGAKTGIKFEDLNADGDRDAGEPVISGWPIFLYTDADGDGVLDAGEIASKQSTTTDANGAYRFPNLGTGKFIACEASRSAQGWFQSAPLAGTGVTNTCGADTGNATRGYAFEMTGTDHPNNDFGNFRNATISGTKFKDADADGVIDSGETGLAGWTIHVFGPGGSHASTVTDTNGDYSFSGLAPGNYVVCEEIGNQANWVQTHPISGSGDCTLQTFPGAVLADEGHAVTTTSNGSFGDRDFANAPESSITVTFNPLATLQGGGDATEATDITCTDANNNQIGTTGGNSVTTDEVLTSGSVVTCTIEFVDP